MIAHKYFEERLSQEVDRGGGVSDASKFVATIAQQLANYNNIPPLQSSISEIRSYYRMEYSNIASQWRQSTVSLFSLHRAPH